mmetsp:Transcript_63911/g.113662  ORF Transcript_63911/g.113662 Transcript_63911/m.113662 type:complete len:169 (-) Transcript_63911:156-662(-)
MSLSGIQASLPLKPYTELASFFFEANHCQTAFDIQLLSSASQDAMHATKEGQTSSGRLMQSLLLGVLGLLGRSFDTCQQGMICCCELAALRFQQRLQVSMESWIHSQVTYFCASGLALKAVGLRRHPMAQSWLCVGASPAKNHTLAPYDAGASDIECTSQVCSDMQKL